MMSGRITDLVWVLVAFFMGFATGVISTSTYLAVSGPQAATQEESLVTTALYTAARAVIEQGYNFESESAVAGWRVGLESVQNSSTAQLPCMDERICTREEWYIDAVRHFGTIAETSASWEPVAIWTLGVRKAVNDLDACRTNHARPEVVCDYLLGKVLMVAKAPPVM